MQLVYIPNATIHFTKYYRYTELCVYLKPTNISDALSLMSYIAAGLAYINFSDCIKDTLIVQSHVSSEYFIRK